MVQTQGGQQGPWNRLHGFGDDFQSQAADPDVIRSADTLCGSIKLMKSDCMQQLARHAAGARIGREAVHATLDTSSSIGHCAAAVSSYIAFMCAIYSNDG